MIGLDLPIFLQIEKQAAYNIIEKLSKEFDDLSSKKIIVFTSEDIESRFKEIIIKIRSEHELLEIYKVETSSYDTSVQAAKKISIQDYDIVIGLGGGQILDTAKYAAYVSKKVYIAVPTTLSNDGVASPIAVLKTDKGKAKSFGCKSPDGIIIDINLIQNAPKNLICAGIGDTVSNFTALYDWKLESAHKNVHANDFAYLLADTALNMLLFSSESNFKSEAFVRQLSQSLVLSGLAMSIAQSSRPCSGSEHLFSHALDEKYSLNIPHGLQVALGTIVSCMLQNRDYSLILNFLKRFEISISPLELGITREIFIDAWMNAKQTRKDRYSILNEIKLNEIVLNNIYNQVVEVL